MLPSLPGASPHLLRDRLGGVRGPVPRLRRHPGPEALGAGHGAGGLRGAAVPGADDEAPLGKRETCRRVSGKGGFISPWAPNSRASRKMGTRCPSWFSRPLTPGVVGAPLADYPFFV